MEGDDGPGDLVGLHRQGAAVVVVLAVEPGLEDRDPGAGRRRPAQVGAVALVELIRRGVALVAEGALDLLDELADGLTQGVRLGLVALA